MRETRLIVDHDFSSRAVRIYIQEFHGSQEVIIGVKEGKIVEQPRERFEPISEVQPLLSMGAHFFDLFLKLVADYAMEKGIKTENENLLKGKLEATEKHLSDVRSHFEKVLTKVISLPVLINATPVQECDATAAK